MSAEKVKIRTRDFRIAEGDSVDLDKLPTRIKAYYSSEEDYLQMMQAQKEQLAEWQELLYASETYALLLVFQAMDAAGKDGTIEHVMSGINPQGCQVFSFGRPSDRELSHDFLWRTYECLPERGRIGIFNRSYYEEVLVVKVHPNILDSQKLPEEIHNDPKIWKGRYKSIIDMENHLYRNGTRIVKFYLHVSKEEQRQRFLARIEEKDKNWKFSITDVQERKFWDDYRSAFNACLSATSTDEAPWYVVPADDKQNMRLLVSEIILDNLDELKLCYPKAGSDRELELQKIREQLEKEGPAQAAK
jgi:PPK2 family polyphosphate:nucleotide phosphotransferase